MIRLNLSIYKSLTDHPLSILLTYNNPPEVKINNGIRKGVKQKDMSSQN